MARLATSSKSMRVTCHSIVSSGRATWLVSATGIQEEAQRLQAAAWVLQATPVAAYTAEVLVRAPSLPLHIAKQIVAAGARVTFTPLLAAASSMAAGLEVWVQAQKELGIRTDIPSAAEAICCSSIRDIYINWPGPEEEVPAGATAAGLLQLAMNNSSHAAAEAAAYHIPGQLEPELARKLLTTAALRQHVSAVQHMTGLPVMRQSADAAAVCSTVKELVAPASRPGHLDVWWIDLQDPTHSCFYIAAPYTELRSFCTRAVCALPAAAQLSADMLQQLLLAALQVYTDKRCVRKLCRLPAAHQLSTLQVVQIFQANFKLDRFECVPHICRLPAANHIDAHMLVQLFKTAFMKGSKYSARGFCRLPGAQQISSGMLLQLLQETVEQMPSPCDVDVDVISDCIQRLPAAAGISKDDAMQLMTLACQVKNDAVVCQLCALPVVGHLEVEEILQLLLAAAEHSCGDALSTLCELLAAQQLSCEQLVQVVSLIVAQHAQGFVPAQSFVPRVFFHTRGFLPATELFSSDQMVHMLAAAVHHDNYECMLELYNLQAADELSHGHIIPLLETAIELGHDECAKLLWSQLAGQLDEIHRAQAMQLLMAAVRHGSSSWVAKFIGSLSAAGQLDSTQVAKLLTDAAENGSVGCMNELWELPSSQQLSRDAVAGLLLVATNQGILSTACGARLLSLPAASELESVDLVRLLQAAVKHKDAELVQQLCRFPAADSISCEIAASLLDAAVCQQAAACVRELCELRSAGELCVEQVSPLLAMAVMRKDCDCVSDLLFLSEALQLGPACLVPAIKAAVADDDAGFVKQLCRLNAAQHLSSECVVELLQAAVRSGSAGLGIEALCRLPAAQQLSSTDVLHGLMLAAAEYGGAYCMLQLSKLPVAEQLTSSHILRLLEVAVAVGGGSCTEVLCQLPAASELGVAAVAQLLQAAKQQGSGGCEEQLRRLHARV